DAAQSQPAGQVDEAAIVGKSKARAQGREPAVVLGELLYHAEGRHEHRLGGVVPPPSDIRLKPPNESVELVIVPSLDPADQAVGVEIAAGAAVGGAAGDGHARRQRRCREIELGHGIYEAGMPSYIDTCPAHRRWIIGD